MSEVYYFGCYREIGHYLYTPLGYVSYRSGLPFKDSELDGTFVPYLSPTRRHVPSKTDPETGVYEPQSHARLGFWRGYTILGMFDRSLDKRHNSSSTFLVHGGPHDFDTMKGIITRAGVFGEVWARIEAAAPIIVVEKEGVP